MKVILLGLMILSQAFANIIVNKGPVFAFPEKRDQKYDQNDLIRDYVFFKIQNAYKDEENLEKVRRLGQKYKQLEKEGKMSFKLPEFHYDLDFDAFPFTYGTSGTYSQYSFLKILYGLCMGFTTGLRKFHYFAYFKPEMKAPFDKETEKQKWLTFYQGLVDKVMRDEVTIIPGFKDLYELADKELRVYIQRHLADQWAINNLSIKGAIYLTSYFKGPEDKKEVSELRQEMISYLEKNFEPRVIWRWGETVRNTHIMRVKKVYPMQEECFDYEYINTDSITHMERVCPGEKIEIVKGEFERFTAYFESYKKFCQKNKKFCEENINY